MKWMATRMRRGGRAAGSDEQAIEDVIGAVSPEELREFLEADVAEVPADPEFKERLRQRLWKMVQTRARDQAPEKG